MSSKAILGISAYYHDSAAALLIDGKIIAAAHEERFTRKKHDPSFPTEAIKYVLEEGGLTLADLDAIAFYDKPFIKFERLLETYHAFAPAGLGSFLSAIPVWIKEKLFMKKMLNEELAEFGKTKAKIYFPEHHLSHAASAYYPSKFDEAAILTVDGVGEWATTTICKGKGKDIEIIKELDFPHSIGLLYSAFTYYLGFKVNSGEYKLMGLAPYGNPDAEETKEFKKIILEHLVDIREDGSILLNMKYFKYPTGLRMTYDDRWNKIFNLERRESESELTQRHMNLALAIQQVTEDIVMKLAKHARELTGCKNLVMAGGVALNCVANGKILQEGFYENMWIQPAAGDAGGALGAAYAVWHIHMGEEKPTLNGVKDSMYGSYLGPEFSDKSINHVIRKYGAKATHYENFDELAAEVAKQIHEGNVIGWFQGRMEYGPRALGNRSILGDGRNPEMQKKMNLKIKYREGFRPFAPSVLEEDVQNYFDIPSESPYMLLVAPVTESERKPVPENYNSLELYDRLYHLRSNIPAITHVDFSARIQTVSQQTNPRYWNLINEFKKLSGYGVIVNTSFNVRGEPIVCTPDDGYRCFMRTEMDFLVMGNYLFTKTEQGEFEDNEKWREEFVLD